MPYPFPTSPWPAMRRIDVYTFYRKKTKTWRVRPEEIDLDVGDTVVLRSREKGRRSVTYSFPRGHPFAQQEGVAFTQKLAPGGNTARFTVREDADVGKLYCFCVYVTEVKNPIDQEATGPQEVGCDDLCLDPRGATDDVPFDADAEAEDVDELNDDQTTEKELVGVRPRMRVRG